MNARYGRGDQAEFWSGGAGNAWVDAQAMLDRLFQPVEALIVDAMAEAAPEQVLDVGCGTGGTTLASARRLDPIGRCTGIDISEPMIAAARARAELESLPARFVRADAETYDFHPASFDMTISRFGIMFFADPVRAFANLCRASRAGATLGLVAWRSAAENPFMTTAERAAAPLLPNLPRREEEGPGQFAFGDRDRVHRILEESGWRAIDIRPVDLPCVLPETDLPAYLTRFGPVGRALDGADERTRAEVLRAIRPAFDPFLLGSEVRFPAACWMIVARAPAD